VFKAVEDRGYMYMRTAIIAVALLAMLGTTGCVTGKDMERLETKLNTQTGEIRSIRQDLDEVRYTLDDHAKSTKAMTSKVDEISTGLDAIREDLEVVKRNQANLGNKVFTMSGGEAMGAAGKFDELDHEIKDTKLKLDAFKAALLQKLSDIEYAVSNVQPQAAAGEAAGGAGMGTAGAGTSASEGTEATGGETPTAGAAEQGGEQRAGSQTGTAEGLLDFGGGADTGEENPPPVDDPIILYNAAYMDYTKGNYELALMGFKDYLKSFPDGELAANSQYWIGESLYSMGHYTQAIIEFEKVITNYPKSPKVPAAILKKGYCFEKLGRNDDAMASFREVVEKYPSSEPAGIAEQKLNPPRRGVVEGR